MAQNPYEYVNNPLNAFVLIKTLTNDVEKIQESLNETFESFKESTEKFKLPQENFEGAVAGFVRLQKIYELKSENLAEGKIEEVKIRDELSTLELFTLANEIMRTDRQIADEYFKIALEKSKGDLKVEIMEKMLENYRKMRKFSKAVEMIEEIVKVEGKIIHSRGTQLSRGKKLSFLYFNTFKPTILGKK